MITDPSIALKKICHAVLGVILLTGCNPEQMEKSRAGPAERSTHLSLEEKPVTPPVTKMIGDRLRSAGIIAESWEVATKNAAPEDRAYLQFVQEKYPGIVEFSSQEERNFLERLSIPPPEEWLEASRISDAELEKMINDGNVRATAFYADRITDRYQEILDLAGTQDPSKVHELAPDLVDELMSMNVKASTAALMALRQSPSPFTAYVYGRQSSIVGGAKFPIPASYEVAYDLGDHRARDFTRHFEMTNAPTAPGATLGSYKHIRKMAGL